MPDVLFVNAASVSRQMTGAGEHHTAVVTFARIFARVGTLVENQGAAVGERLAALATFKRLLCGVYPPVAPPCALLGKRLPAIVTAVPSLSCVGQEMAVEPVLPCEHQATLVTLEGLAACTRAAVSIAETLGRKRFPAVVAWECLVIRRVLVPMASQVAPQSERHTTCFTFVGCLTLGISAAVAG